MKKFLLFILVATASAQAWPFHKKPKYVGVGPTLEEQKATEANQQWEKAKADQWERIKGLRQQLLESDPISEIEITKKERLATGELCFLGEHPISLDEYENWLGQEVNKMKASKARDAILRDVEKAIFEAKNEKSLEPAIQRIDALKKELSAEETPVSWRDSNFRIKKGQVDRLITQLNLTQEMLRKDANEAKVKADKIAQADVDYEARKKLSEEERQAIYKTNGAAQQNDFLRSLSPEKREEVERYHAEIAARLASVVHQRRAEQDFSASGDKSASVGPIFSQEEIHSIIKENREASDKRLDESLKRYDATMDALTAANIAAIQKCNRELSEPATITLRPTGPGVLQGGGYTVRDMGPLGVSVTKP
jgi:hypothetical protein